MKTKNEYQSYLDQEFYRKCPKAVLAAIAVSFASFGGNDLKDVTKKLMEEWDILNKAGIVPQKVIK